MKKITLIGLEQIELEQATALVTSCSPLGAPPERGAASYGPSLPCIRHGVTHREAHKYSVANTDECRAATSVAVS